MRLLKALHVWITSSLLLGGCSLVVGGDELARVDSDVVSHGDPSRPPSTGDSVAMPSNLKQWSGHPWPDVRWGEQGVVTLVDTDECSLPSDSLLPVVDTVSTVATQTGGPELCVVDANSFRVPPDTFVVAHGRRPLVVRVATDARIDGVLSVAAFDGIPGAGGSESDAGALPGQQGPHAAPWSSGGGGGGGLCGEGGPGGSASNANGGFGGETMDADWQLVPLFGGSGGGTGDSPDVAGGRGGPGGGAIQLSVRGVLTLGARSAVLAGGGGAEGGFRMGADWGSGGGGGSGGAVLVEANRIEVMTDGGSIPRILADGGGGGAGASGQWGHGTHGEDARELQARGRAEGGDATGLDGAAGGDASFGDGLHGLSGSSVDLEGGNAGGGGGGAGCILIRTATGESGVHGPVMISPSVAPALRFDVWE